MLFGAHVSIAGGVLNAPLNAQAIGCEVFQLFTRSPRGGSPPSLTEQIVRQFKQRCRQAAQKEWYVHTPYYINYASSKNRVHSGSILVVREELERASLLGAKYLMTHLGSYKDLGRKKGLPRLIDGLEQTLRGYRGSTGFLLEIAAGAGQIIGDSFADLGEIIHHPRLKKYDMGVCYDTQHGFAGGYDIRTAAAVERVWSEFDNLVGLEKLKMSHINDSLTELGSHQDRHAHIGRGKIGLSGFNNLLSNVKMRKINFVLETKHDQVKTDLIKLKKIREKICRT